jgi:hypothetical protein
MIEDIKPVWFYLGRTEGKEGGIKHWCLNIGLYFIDFGRAY